MPLNCSTLGLMALMLSGVAMAAPTAAGTPSFPPTPMPPMRECVPSGDQLPGEDPTYISYLFQNHATFPYGYRAGCPKATLTQVYAAEWNMSLNGIINPGQDIPTLCPDLGNNTGVLYDLLGEGFQFTNGSYANSC